MQNHHLIRFVFKEIHFGQLHREWIYVVSQDPINKNTNHSMHSRQEEFDTKKELNYQRGYESIPGLGNNSRKLLPFLG